MKMYKWGEWGNPINAKTHFIKIVQQAGHDYTLTFAGVDI